MSSFFHNTTLNILNHICQQTRIHGVTSEWGYWKMKKKTLINLIAVIAIAMLFPTTVYANSSWHWLTKTVPFDILSYVVILTLVIEYFSLKTVNSIKKHLRLLLVICAANLASYLLPFAILLLPSGVGYTFEMSINRLPIYIIGAGYIVLTLIVEVPAVYFSLRGTVKNKEKLVISIIIVNVITTIMVAVIERIVCKGSW